MHQDRKVIRIILPVCLSLLKVTGCYPKRIGPPGPDGKPLTWQQMNKEQPLRFWLLLLSPGTRRTPVRELIPWVPGRRLSDR